MDCSQLFSAGICAHITTFNSTISLINLQIIHKKCFIPWEFSKWIAIFDIYLSFKSVSSIVNSLMMGFN